MTQSALSRYSNLIKFHGPINGLRRAWDQFFQVDLYDYIHGIDTRHICTGDEFQEGIKRPSQVTVHYQPVYTDAIRKPLRFVKRMICDGARVAFIDLGCGCGKALHVASKELPGATIIGVEIHAVLANEARLNVPNALVVNKSVLDMDYRDLLKPFTQVVVFNKNSFSRGLTEEVMCRILGAHPRVAVIYNNPLHSDILAGPPIFTMTGWHKNWNTSVFA